MLTVNVQVDRLPDLVRDGRTFIQLGLRVSANVDPLDGAVPDEMRPWKWQTAAGESWGIHDPGHWVIWADGLEQPAGGPPASAVPGLTLLTGWSRTIDPPPIHTEGLDRFKGRVEQSLKDLAGAPSSNSSAVGTGPSYRSMQYAAFIESLTQLPAPIPAWMNVWTCLELPADAQIGDKTLFVAIPQFAETAGAENLAPQKTADHYQLTVPPPVATIPAAASVVCHPSLTMNAMKNDGKDVERLVDISRLGILAPPSAPALESGDWLTHLPQKVADVLNPITCALAALEPSVHDWLSQSPDNRKELESDVAGSDIVRRMLTLLCAPYLGSPYTGSPGMMSVGERISSLIATRNVYLQADVWAARLGQQCVEARLDQDFSDSSRGIAESMQRFASLIDDGNHPNGIRLLTRQAIRQIADIPSNPPTDETHAPPKDEAPSNILSTPEGARQWYAQEYVGRSISIAAFADANKRQIGTWLLRWVSREDGQAGHKLDCQPLSDFDLSWLAAKAVPNAGVTPQPPPSVTLTLSVELPQAASSFQIGFPFDPNQALTIQLTRAGITVNPGAQILTPNPPTQLSLRWTSSQRGITINWSLDNNAWQPAEFAWPDVPVVPWIILTAGASVTPASIDRDSLAKRVAQALADEDSFQPLNHSAEVHATQVLSLLIQGGVPGTNNAYSGDLRARFIPALQEYSKQWLASVFDAAIAKAAPVGTPPTVPIRRLLDIIKSNSIALADRHARRILPDKDSAVLSGVTQAPNPLVFQIDQLQSFDHMIDVWTRLSGVGVLLGRLSVGGQPKREWWSLNVATLHVDGREPCNGENAVSLSSTDPRDWHQEARVDPVPAAVSEVQGTRSILVSYHGQSLVSDMQSSMDHETTDSHYPLRRPERFFFPVGTRSELITFPRLPALTFGRTYYGLPYLIAHGGVLPIWLRDPGSHDPTRRCEYQPAPDSDGKSTIRRGRLSESGEWPQTDIRPRAYLRTVCVGPPRLGKGSVLPGLAEGVRPISAELDIHLPPVTVEGSTYFYLDSSGARGILQAPSGPGALMRVEFGTIRCSEAESATITLVVWRRVDDNDHEKCGEISFDVQREGRGDGSSREFRPRGVRIDFTLNQASLYRLIWDSQLAEDEPDTDCDAEQTYPLNLPMQDDKGVPWDGVYFEVQAKADAVVTLEPPTVAIGTQRDCKAQVGRARIPPEVHAGKRNIQLLDGLSDANSKKRLVISARRPAADFQTFERWINGGLSDDGYGDTAHRDTIANALNSAAKLSRLQKDDRSLDDPAVSGVAVEAIRIFPEYSRIGSVTVLGAASASSEFPGYDAANSSFSTELGPLEVSVGNQETFVGNSLTAVPGAVYEIRLFAMIPLDPQPPFAKDIVVRNRFAPFARQSWRREQVDGSQWYLGPPAIVFVEVATDMMVDIYDCAPLHFELQRPPDVAEDRALVRLDPRKVNLTGLPRYALRYASDAGLVAQRWNWRGRPQPTLALDAESDQSQEEYFDSSFAGRSDDDVGTAVVRDLTKQHVYAGRRQLSAVFPTSGNAPPSAAPILFNRPIDYRGGANLWRFGLKLTSRYASLRPQGDTRFTTRSYLQGGPSKSSTWQRLLVKDRDNPDRHLQRPGLLVVLPLTESAHQPGKAPPILAVFNEPMHLFGNAGDGIEASIEMARHPRTTTDMKLPIANAIAKLDSFAPRTYDTKVPADLDFLDKAISEVSDGLENLSQRWLADQDSPAVAFLTAFLEAPNDKTSDSLAKPDLLLTPENRDLLRRLLEQANASLAAKPTDARWPVSGPKYWPEESLDQIRTARGRDGAATAVRCDGPIGYTFDPSVESGLFNHAAFVVSTIASRGENTGPEPWSMAKLRFRRIEAPELFVDAKRLTSSRCRVRIANLPDTAPVADARQADLISFEPRHEGVALDIGGLSGRISLTLCWSGDPTSFLRVFSEVTETESGRDVQIHTETNLGPSGNWTASFDADAQLSLRVIAAQRPLPTDGEPYAPTADVSLCFRADQPRATSTFLGSEGTWLTVLTGTLSASFLSDGKSQDLVTFDINQPRSAEFDTFSSAREAAIALRAIRVSELTPGVWCQFAADMSEFLCLTDKNESTVVSTTSLRARRQGSRLDIQLTASAMMDSTAPPALLGLATAGAPDGTSRLEEALFAILTRYVYDANGKKCETIAAIYELPLLHPAQYDRAAIYSTSAKDDDLVWSPTGTSVLTGSGRVRLMRALRARPGKNDKNARTNQFRRLFLTDMGTGADLDMNPQDAAGLVLGVSKPIELNP